MPDESIRSALYYPHTGVRTTELLKSGLLLWDTVEFIAPDRYIQPDLPRDAPPKERKLIEEAMELLLVRHVPSDEERERAHQTVKLLVNSDLAERLRQMESANTAYLIYPKKFLPKTWVLLEETELATVDLKDPDRDYMMSRALGLILMSILADSCAGSLKRTVTDQQAAYTTVRESVLKNTIAPTSTDRSGTELLDVTLRVADLRRIPLKDLVALRKREFKEGATSSLTDLRRALASRIDTTAQLIGQTKAKADRKTIVAQFEDDMKRDLARLKRDLGGLSWNIVFSREFAAAVFIGLGLLSVPGGQAAAGAAALAGVAVAYRKQRLEILAKHPMSWLYLQT